MKPLEALLGTFWIASCGFCIYIGATSVKPIIRTEYELPIVIHIHRNTGTYYPKTGKPVEANFYTIIPEVGEIKMYITDKTGSVIKIYDQNRWLTNSDYEQE